MTPEQLGAPDVDDAIIEKQAIHVGILPVLPLSQIVDAVPHTTGNVI